MKTSQLFTKTSKTAPADETSRSAELLLRAGYIYKEMAGVYDFLPLGMRTLQNIIQVIREEMNALGAQELTMSTLQSKAVWEAFTRLMKSYISSYKDLPIYVYQFQNKFRNELRAKSGIMRTREFIMKDLYSFCIDRKQHEKFYEEVAKSYARIFDRLGIGDKTYRTFASGGSFCKFSDEFQTLCEAGEDIIYIDKESGIALNEEVLTDENLENLGIKRENLTEHKAAEVGNIFTLGYKYADALDLNFNDESGKRQKVFMGSYGIGPSRVMGVIAEMLSDDKGLVWPEEIAPYKYYLVGLGEEGNKKAAELHDKAPELVFFDDRDARAGEKFADAELMGMPYRVVISDKTLANNQVEVMNRKTGETKLLTLDEFEHKLV